ncbi:hypothetical protein Nepgr_007067 [Nepenthes gracilis]|uniref:Uncharacterized protein n=1 Tax=Nepenthes gracilis TaxID=150966 RepID=A0AAD3S661_NEPGR|nr:hypothetical protein Nepgr_007067 [Nepenthes gracilis]
MSVGLSNIRYCRSAKKCKDKWENMNEHVERSTENRRKHLEITKARLFFQKSEVLYRNRLVGSGNSPSSANDEDEGGSSTEQHVYQISTFTTASVY